MPPKGKKKIPKEPTRRSPRTRQKEKTPPKKVDCKIPKGRKRKNLASSSNENEKQQKFNRTSSDGREIDRFCWECHYLGQDEVCKTCTRVYHRNCIKKLTPFNQEGACPECQADTIDGAMLTYILSVRLLKMLLSYAFNRVVGPKEKMYKKLLYGSSENELVTVMDVYILYDKINDDFTYTKPADVLADIKWISHNCHLLFGADSEETVLANALVKGFKRELIDIEACPECYYHMQAETKSQVSSFFVRVCKYPHIIVWAKMKGYPYWPAKCLKIINGFADVRFFGTHDRTRIPVNHCYVMSKEYPSGKRPKQARFLNSIEEFKGYIKSYEVHFDRFIYAPEKTPLPSELEHLKQMCLIVLPEKATSAGSEMYEIRPWQDSIGRRGGNIASSQAMQHTVLSNVKSTTGYAIEEDGAPPSISMDISVESEGSIENDALMKHLSTNSSQRIPDSTFLRSEPLADARDFTSTINSNGTSKLSKQTRQMLGKKSGCLESGPEGVPFKDIDNIYDVDQLTEDLPHKTVTAESPEKSEKSDVGNEMDKKLDETPLELLEKVEEGIYVYPSALDPKLFVSKATYRKGVIMLSQLLFKKDKLLIKSIKDNIFFLDIFVIRIWALVNNYLNAPEIILAQQNKIRALEKKAAKYESYIKRLKETFEELPEFSDNEDTEECDNSSIKSEISEDSVEFPFPYFVNGNTENVCTASSISDENIEDDCADENVEDHCADENVEDHCADENVEDHCANETVDSDYTKECHDANCKCNNFDEDLKMKCDYLINQTIEKLKMDYEKVQEETEMKIALLQKDNKCLENAKIRLETEKEILKIELRKYAAKVYRQGVSNPRMSSHFEVITLNEVREIIRHQVSLCKEIWDGTNSDIIKELMATDWCVVCYCPGKIHCCRNTNFCTERCQKIHAKDSGHSHKLKKEPSSYDTTNTTISVPFFNSDSSADHHIHSQQNFTQTRNIKQTRVSTTIEVSDQSISTNFINANVLSNVYGSAAAALMANPIPMNAQASMFQVLPSTSQVQMPGTSTILM